MRPLGRGVWQFSLPPRILSQGAVGGRREAAGPLGGELDQTFQDTSLGKVTWEQAEAALQGEALSLALGKARLSPEDLDLVLAGDLLNQCVSSTFGLLSFQIPFLGQYGACSTMAQTLLLGAMAVDSGACERAAAVTSSHFCAAERQFRLPLEYGGQRSPTAQWTATAAGAVVLSREEGPVQVERGLAGRIVDPGIRDPANMGAAMAPAAADTLLRFFQATGASPAEYDALFTGDLGVVGSQLLLELLGEQGLDLSSLHQDCGLLLYDRDRQDVHSGGSGCGCSAAVLCGSILPRLAAGEYRRVLFCATGALLSPTTQQQGASIPGICHLVQLGRA